MHAHSPIGHPTFVVVVTSASLPLIFAWLLHFQNTALIKVPMRDDQGRAYGTGRRKTAVARVWVKRGDGLITVNGVPLVDYFPRMSHRVHVLEPFVATDSTGAFDVMLTVSGGGLSGQCLHSSLPHGVPDTVGRMCLHSTDPGV
jgi:hypothetical protein